MVTRYSIIKLVSPLIVFLARLDRKTGALSHLSVNACLAPVVSMHGLAVTTVEGIGGAKVRIARSSCSFF